MLAQECVTKSIYNREESRTKRLRRIPFKKNQSENSRDQLNSGTKETEESMNPCGFLPCRLCNYYHKQRTQRWG